MLFSYRHTQHLMKTMPYAARALSQLTEKAINDFVSIVVSNSNGDNFSWKTNIAGGNDFPLNYALNSEIRTILSKDSGIMHYTGHDLYPIPWQISDLKDDPFVEIMVRSGDTTNSHIISEIISPFDVTSLTTQANGLVSRIIAEVTSQVSTFVFFTEDGSSTDPILLGYGLNTGNEF